MKSGQGGVGATRECVSDKGITAQEILEWQPNRRLTFALRETDIYFGPCVKSIVEDFEIKPVDESTTAVTRTTEYKLVNGLQCLAAVPMFIGLKAIHRYVFKNWKRLSQASLHNPA